MLMIVKNFSERVDLLRWPTWQRVRRRLDLLVILGVVIAVSLWSGSLQWAMRELCLCGVNQIIWFSGLQVWVYK